MVFCCMLSFPYVTAIMAGAFFPNLGCS